MPRSSSMAADRSICLFREPAGSCDQSETDLLGLYARGELVEDTGIRPGKWDDDGRKPQ